LVAKASASGHVRQLSMYTSL